MSWMSPIAAWFLLLIPAVVLLYFLRLRRDDVRVSSTLLWSRVLDDRRVNAPFQRLRNSLLLLLQILAIILLVGALARPETETDEVQGLAHILLVDVSASMATEDGGETRLEKTRDLVKEYIRGIGKSERAVVVRFARSAKALTPVTDDRSVLRDAVSKLTVRPGSTSIDAAMELAVSIARNQVDARAVIFSDGGFPAWEAGEVPLPVEYVPVGSEVGNSGIVALASRLDLAGRPQIFVELRNFSDEPVQGDLDILQNGELVRADEPSIAPQGKWNGSFEAELEGLVDVIWKPDSGNGLSLDDRAWVQLNARSDIRLWRVGEGNYFLDGALAAQPRVDAEKVSLAEVETRLRDGDSPPDVILWDRVAPAELPEVTGHLFLGALPPGIWSTAERRELPEIVTWDRTHPVNRFLTYGNIVVRECHVLPPEPGTTVIVDTRGGGLISVFTVPGSRGIVAFDVLESDWPLRLSFPLFLHNALQYLSLSNAAGGVGIQAEELLKLKGIPGAEGYEIHRPDGRTIPAAVDGDTWLRYSETDVLGPFEISWTETDFRGEQEKHSRVIPVNLLSARESDVAPRKSLEIAGRQVAATEGNIAKARSEYWPWILFVGLLLVLGEWFCYHRR